jgi:CheY-like chemotaxis protein
MKTILVIEDADDLRELFVGIIGARGYRAIGAEHGKEALEILAALESEPCLILMDMMMPVMDGPELLNALRKTHRIASLPIVILSAQSPGPEGDDAKKVVKKPISSQGLLALVEEFCGPP